MYFQNLNKKVKELKSYKFEYFLNVLHTAQNRQQIVHLFDSF